MKNFKTFSTNDIIRRKKNNFLSPLKLKGTLKANHYLLNLKIINNISSELDINNIINLTLFFSESYFPLNKNKLFPKNTKT